MDNEKLKILIISQTPWREDNSFGNSYSNIFGRIKNIDIANIYCGEGLPETKIVNKFFQISEKLLVKNLLNSSNKSGIIVNSSENEVFKNSNLNNPQVYSSFEKKMFEFFQKHRFQFIFWIRELIWKFGNWNSMELKLFLDDFNPDLIFMPIYNWPYMNRIGFKVKNYTNKRMVGYISDDHYSLNQFSLSPFFWIDRFINRFFLKKIIKKCDILYTISKEQKLFFEQNFKNKIVKILYKGNDFNKKINATNIPKTPLKLLYTGNIGDGRYKSLFLIGLALDSINKNENKAILSIYTATPISNNIRSLFTKTKSINLYGPIPINKVFIEQNKSDILIHVESFKRKDKLLVKHSFSTKIVDYLYASKCIFAVGPFDVASIAYLLEKNAGIVACNEKEIEEKLNELVMHPNRIIEYGKLAWQCGNKYHNIEKIQRELHEDLVSLKKNKCAE